MTPEFRAPGAWRRRLLRPRPQTAVVVYDNLQDPLEYHSVRFAHLLVRAGWDVHIVGRGDTPSPAQQEGATVWWEPSQVAVLRRLVRLRPELVFVESAVHGLVAPLLVPATWVRSPVPSASRVKQAVLRRLLERAAAVTFTNPGALAEWPGLDLQLTDLPYPFDVAFWREPMERRPALWEEMGLPVPPGPVVVYVANIIERKGHPALVRALTPLLEATPDLRLVLVGRPYEDRAATALDRARAESGVADQILLTGWQPWEVVREIMAWATVQIINSGWESQCMALYEGLAAGVPALISDISGLTSAFPDLPAHRDEQELAENLAALLADDERRAALVAGAQDRVEWADVHRHDRLFYETASRLVGRPVAATDA